MNKKRLKEELTKEELEYFFNGYMNDEITDYQMSSLLMAICINGMSEEETFALTKIFVDSGDILDLSSISGIKVDKHSTGGVGDKTTLIIGPIVASLGVNFFKMSGRGLGFTGGTIDKLESIPGFNTNLTEEEMIKQVKDIGIVVASACKQLVPMDKKIYALRDVTGTVGSIPLIAISVMSKKIAGGASKIVIDIKVGKGAFMKNRQDAEKLGELMKKIGNSYDREVRILISEMDNPLGYMIGNSLEVKEAIDVLSGKGEKKLTKLCVELASNMISMGKNISIDEAKEEVLEVISTGKAYKKFLEFVKYQGGNIECLSVSDNVKEVVSSKTGIIKAIDALKFGELSVSLGAGRVKKDDSINPEVGIKLNYQVGDMVKQGNKLCEIYTNKDINLKEIENFFTINE